MKDFKLLAIRPLRDCAKKYRKVLKPGEFYKFYNGTSFYDFEEEIPRNLIIKYQSDTPNNFYGAVSGPRRPGINISAVVGKNGSGKSSLIELLFVAIYNFSLEKKILKNRRVKNRLGYEPNVRVDIFYQMDNYIYCLRVYSGENRDVDTQLESVSFVYRYKVGPNGTYGFEKEMDNHSKLIYPYFFYSIAINYSIYGLNSKEIGSWIKYLFHKNDGYQTPLVINPLRTDGKINIVIENILVKQRLLSNILEPLGENILAKNSLRNLAEGKTVSSLQLTMNTEKVEKYTVNNGIKEVENGMETISSLFEAYTAYNIDNVENEPELQTTKVYILYKLVRMCRTYSRYRPFLKDNRFQREPDLINKIIKDNSHITFKIKQALNFLRFRLYIDNSTSYRINIPIEQYSDYIKEIIKDEFENKNRIIQTIELIPPSIYDVRIMFDDTHSFDDFSSGEKQKVHGISSIIYHLININSVFKNGELVKSKIQNTYDYVNVIFDEIELYFHPDLQRTFIKDLVDYIGKINTANVEHIEGINMVFLTHSPFILSDVPSENVMYLEVDNETGEAGQKIDIAQTFGANIHDLLANEFFMQNGFMGEWVKTRIKSALKYLDECKKRRMESLPPNNVEWDKDSVRVFINLMGEPMIRKSMLDLYFAAFGMEELEKEIARLQAIKDGGAIS